MFLVDTNLLLYAANQSAPQHPSARRFLDESRRGSEAWLATWSIFYEFLRVATHPAVFTRPLPLAVAWQFLQAATDSASFQMLQETERHAEVVRDLAGRHPAIHGNDVHDLHIAAVMFEHGVSEIRTADASFHRFRFLRVSNPLAPRS